VLTIIQQLKKAQNTNTKTQMNLKKTQNTNTKTQMNLRTVQWAQCDKTQSREL